MISAIEARNLQMLLRNQIRGNGNDGPCGDALTCIYAIAFAGHPEDALAAWDDLRSVAVTGYDEADAALNPDAWTAHGNRADDAYDSYRMDVGVLS